MEELRNLKQIYSLAADRFRQYDGKDFVLPQVFKNQVTEINSNTITYNEYSAVIETRGHQNGVLNIFLPNQWFYIASYFTDFYNELQRYKKEALKVVSKERLKELNGSSLTELEELRLQQLSLSEQSKSYLRRFVTDYSWWSGAKTIDRGDFYVSPILNSAKLVNASQSFVADLCAFLADKKDLAQAIISGEESSSKERAFTNLSFKLQQIFYGAPGTGKSHKIKDNAKVKEADKKNLVFRTTFHPDSDYSTFVGAYKPTMKPVADKYKAVAGKDEEISYSFVPQAFLQAYIAAWNNPEDKVFLVIEEINRGNCAQIFGDLFQLLDRDSDGFSEYPIKADKDLAQYLSGKDENGQDILTNKDGIKDGKLCLPSNLYIWATMNTSDQSLFPIDSAFKRRWEWVYMPIDTAKEAWFVKVGDKYYSWTKFLNAINDEVLTDETAEDKHLGFYFCKATQKRNESDTEPSVITAETFVGKVLFYLWNDVFKVYGIPTSIGPSKDWGFRKFYKTDGNVNQEKVAELMAKLKIDAEPEPEQPNTDTQPE